MSFLKKLLKKINRISGFKGYNLKKHANDEEEYLPKHLTPLSDFGTQVMQVDEIDPSYVNAMKVYINQNANIGQPTAIPSIWIEDENLRKYFQNLSQQVLGNMSEAFVSRVFQATRDEQEGYRGVPKQQVPQEAIQGDYIDLNTDLVTTFLESPHALAVLDSISSSILKSGYGNVQNKDTANARAWQSVNFALAPPIEKKRGGLRRDQRFNYFLFNPDKMPENVAQGYQQVLASSPNIKKDQIIEYLKTNFGDDLINVLYENINNNDPSIQQWILKQEGHVGKEESDESLGTSLTGGEEGGYSLQQEDIGAMNLSRVEQREKDIREIEDQKTTLLDKANLTFAKLYLQDLIRDMREVLSRAIEISYNKYPGKYSYNVERMNLYNKKLLDQYLSVLNSPPTMDPKTGNVVFKNNEGILTIPSTSIESVFKGNIDKTPQQLYDDIVEQRKIGEGKFDILDWFKQSQDRGVLSTVALQKSYREAYLIKTRIKDLDKKNFPEDTIVTKMNEESEEVGKIFRKLSNADNENYTSDKQLSNDEKKRRMLRYVKMTLAKEGKDNYEMFEGYSKMNFGKIEEGSEEFAKAVNSLKPLAQYDSVYLMEGLNDVKQDQSDPYYNDVFKAFLGTLNPHKRVKTKKFPKIYKNLLGEEKEEEPEDNLSMLTKGDKIKYIKLKNAKMLYDSTIQAKQETIKTQEGRARVVVDRYHKKIKRAFEEFNKKRKSEGRSEVSIGEYVASPGWDGESMLLIGDYLRMGITKAEDALWGQKFATHWRDFGPIRRIEEIKKGGIVYKEEDGKVVLNNEGNPVQDNIRKQSISFIQKKLDEVSIVLDKFKQDHNITNAQDVLAEALCRNFMKKMSSVEEIRSRYTNIKVAFDTSIIEKTIYNIKIEFEAGFNRIFNI